MGQPLSHVERIGLSAIADSPDEVRLRAREQLMLGASFLKLMTGGGVSSPCCAVSPCCTWDTTGCGAGAR